MLYPGAEAGLEMEEQEAHKIVEHLLLFGPETYPEGKKQVLISRLRESTAKTPPQRIPFQLLPST